MKSSDSIYVFFSSNFFKQMVNLGISDINTKDLFNFRFQNTTSPESGWYEFSTSNTLIIKPRDFSISIISDEYTSAPSREGYVGSGEPALDFGYIVTTSGKTAADEVLIKVTGPAQVIGGRSYCLFSSDDGTAKVPFPATLSFITRSGTTQTYDAGCDDSWRDMTDALWLTTPWTDISGEVGQMDKTTVKFSIPMDNAISLRTVDDNGWFGEVSASGEIHVRGRRGATLTKALLTVGCLLAAPLAQAISVGNLTFSLPAEADFASKRVVNNNKSARLYRIAVSAIDRPGGSEVRSRPVDGELLFAPRQLVLQAGESEYFKFYYHGPRDNRERYYRVSFREIPTRNLTRRSPTGGEVSMEPVVVMDTILVVRPREVQFKWSFDKVAGTVSNTGNTSV